MKDFFLFGSRKKKRLTRSKPFSSPNLENRNSYSILYICTNVGKYNFPIAWSLRKLIIRWIILFEFKKLFLLLEESSPPSLFNSQKVVGLTVRTVGTTSAGLWGLWIHLHVLKSYPVSWRFPILLTFFIKPYISTYYFPRPFSELFSFNFSYPLNFVLFVHRTLQELSKRNSRSKNFSPRSYEGS